MSKTLMIIVTVQLRDPGPFVSEVPTSKSTPPDLGNLDPVGSAGQGTPLLTAMLQSGNWSIQSIQQLGQQSASGALVNAFLLVSNA